MVERNALKAFTSSYTTVVVTFHGHTLYSLYTPLCDGHANIPPPPFDPHGTLQIYVLAKEID